MPRIIICSLFSFSYSARLKSNNRTFEIRLENRMFRFFLSLWYISIRVFFLLRRVWIFGASGRLPLEITFYEVWKRIWAGYFVEKTLLSLTELTFSNHHTSHILNERVKNDFLELAAAHYHIRPLDSYVLLRTTFVHRLSSCQNWIMKTCSRITGFTSRKWGNTLFLQLLKFGEIQNRDSEALFQI